MSDEVPEESTDLHGNDAAGLSVMALYERALGKRGFVADASQYAAVARLQQLFEEWTTYKERRRNALLRMLVKPPLPRGVFLWGGVGRGKTFLMDSFYRALPLVRKRRVHFTISCVTCIASWPG